MGALLTTVQRPHRERTTLISNGCLLFIGIKNTEHWLNLTLSLAACVDEYRYCMGGHLASWKFAPMPMMLYSSMVSLQSIFYYQFVDVGTFGPRKRHDRWSRRIKAKQIWICRQEQRQHSMGLIMWTLVQ
jgi:hypothetical protein